MASTQLNALPGEISLSSFSPLFPLTKRSKQQGYKYFLEGYIHCVSFCKIADKDEVDVRAKSYKSMKKLDAPHTLTVTLGGDCKVINSQCTCISGLSGTCSHTVGLIHTVDHYQKCGLSEVPAEHSATSLPQQWHKPRGKRIRAEAVSSMVMAKAKDDRERKRRPILTTKPSTRIVPPTEEQMALLKAATGTPLSYLVNPSAPVVETPAGNVQFGSCLSQQLKVYGASDVPKSNALPCGDTTFPQPHTTLYVSDNITISNTMCPISLEESHRLEQSTVRQASCDEWHAARKPRITASNFSKILKRKKDVNDKFMASIFNPTPFTSLPTTYGKTHEINAKAAYLTKRNQVHVHDCGLVVNPCYSFLGASPDGKVCDNGVTGILEIKCPYTGRDNTIAECLLLKNFCLSEINGAVHLSPSHDYYYQVQGQLLVTSAPFCDFVVYTSCDLFIQRIYPDGKLQDEIMSKLAVFYRKYAIPYITCINSKLSVVQQEELEDS